MSEALHKMTHALRVLSNKDVADGYKRAAAYLRANVSNADIVNLDDRACATDAIRRENDRRQQGAAA